MYLAALFDKLDLKNAIMVGHSTGGGVVARYLGRHRSKRVYPGFPYGMCTTNADQINADLLAFVKDSGTHSSSRSAGILTTA